MEEDLINELGITSDINIVNEYLVETGARIFNAAQMEQIEKFAIWVVCNKIPL